MTERACCDDIVDVRSRLKNLEEWLDSHESDNKKSMQAIDNKLANIEKRLTSWVNPILSIIVSVLTAAIGLLAGALWAALH